MSRSLRNRRVLLCLLASLAVHVLFLWVYQRWAAEPVLRALRPERFELAPALEPERFEPAPRAAVPEVVMEQLRLAELMMEAPLPEVEAALPSMDLEGLAPEPGLEAGAGLGPAFLPGDTLSYESALADLYRRKLVELRGRRIMVLPLADTTSEAGRRRSRAREIIDRAIEAMGGLERLRAIRDKRVRAESWDRELQAWVPAGVRSYLGGQRYRLDTGPGEARGYDGRQSWHLRYGLLLPPRDQSYSAERWDFLSRFRGDGLIVEYVGRRKMQYRALEAVRVLDTKFGRQRLAYFDREDGLLHAEVEHGRTTSYRQYRETQGVLTPFEINVGYGWGGTGYRWHTELNPGLTADLFEVPEEVSWEPESVRTVVFEHIPVPPGGAASLRLEVEALTQGKLPLDHRRVQAMLGRIPGGGSLPWLEVHHSYLIDTYMKKKLQAAGLLAGPEPPEWRVSWRVEEFRVRGREPPIRHPPIASIRIAVQVKSLRDHGDWEGIVHHRWPVPGRADIDAKSADDLTFRVISMASAGIKVLLDAGPAAQPAATPSAGSSSGSE